MSKVIRIDDEDYLLLMSYAKDGSASDGMRELVKSLVAGPDNVTNVTAGVTKCNNSLTKEMLQSVTEEVVRKVVKEEVGRLKEGIRNVNSEFMQFISSGQGAVRVYKEMQPPKLQTDCATSTCNTQPCNGFVTAATLKKEEDIKFGKVD